MKTWVDGTFKLYSHLGCKKRTWPSCAKSLMSILPYSSLVGFVQPSLNIINLILLLTHNSCHLDITHLFGGQILSLFLSLSPLSHTQSVWWRDPSSIVLNMKHQRIKIMNRAVQSLFHRNVFILFFYSLSSVSESFKIGLFPSHTLPRQISKNSKTKKQKQGGNFVFLFVLLLSRLFLFLFFCVSTWTL